MKLVHRSLLAAIAALAALTVRASVTVDSSPSTINYVPVTFQGDYYYQLAATNSAGTTTNTFVNRLPSPPRSHNPGPTVTNTTINASSTSSQNYQDIPFSLRTYISELNTNLPGLHAPANARLYVDLNTGDFLLIGTNFNYDLTANNLFASINIGSVVSTRSVTGTQNQFTNGVAAGATSTNNSYTYSVFGVSQIILNTATNNTGNTSLSLSANYYWNEAATAQNSLTSGFDQAGFQCQVFGTISTYNGTAYVTNGIFSGYLQGEAATNSVAF